MLEQRESLQQQSRTLETLAEGKSRAEERLRIVTSDLQAREQRAREDQRQIAHLTHSLNQVSKREREVRPGAKCLQPVSPVHIFMIFLTILTNYCVINKKYKVTGILCISPLSRLLCQFIKMFTHFYIKDWKINS